MNREIKFRAMNANNEMIYGLPSEDIHKSTRYNTDYPMRMCWNEGNAHYNQPFKKGTLMQYTGLKDKNGVEIYEGDIVGIDDGAPMIIVFKDACFKVNYHPYDDYDEMFLFDNDELEVIGNIYENPELIK